MIWPTDHRLDVIFKQSFNEAEYDVKNYADPGEYYPPRTDAKMDNILRD